MIDIKNKVDCCGCNACGDICPVECISFHRDEEGFQYPDVDLDKCINCHQCEKVCPIINIDKLKHNDYDKPICYSVQNKNLEDLFNSTSGSAFSALAKKMYKMGGYVGGAIFNDDYSVTEFISSDKSDLEKIRNSKYVQSDSQGFYKQVRDLVKAGEKVLVCGLPCQMAAMRSFLKKDYDNLIIVDLICLGINSPKILRGYIDYLEEKHKSKIVYFKHKNKELGWRNLTIKAEFENGDVEYDKKDTSYFTFGFIGTRTFSRPSCYECKFKGFPRMADITIGDMWGAKQLKDSEYYHDLGTSVILINSEKGKNYFASAKSSFRVDDIDLDTVIKGNRALINPLSPTVEFSREAFYADLNSMLFEDFAHKYINIPAERSISRKAKIKNVIKFVITTQKVSGWNLKTIWQNIYYNLFCKQVHTNLVEGKYISIQKHCVLEIRKGASLFINGKLNLGFKRIRGSKLETRLLVENGANFYSDGGTIYYGADIEVFNNSTLELGKGIVFNINATIICGDKITIGDGVCFGRHVTVRDNNGGHYMSRRFYKDKRPVVIKAHSWLTEHVMVMAGSKIGTGVVVSAGSTVNGKLPNFTLAAGNPATIMDENIYWKA